MRIVHLGPTSLPIGYRQGGAVERRMAELAAAQVARGHQVLLISVAPEHADDRSPAAIDPAVELHDLPCRTRRPVRDLEFLARARTAVRRFSPDVVHVHNNWAGAVMLHGIDAPKVLSVDFFRYRGSGRALAHAGYRRALAAFDLLLPVSEYCGREAARFWKLPAHALRVLPNGVNVDQFRPDAERRTAIRRRYGIDGDVVIGYVGRVCEQKGSDTLIEAYTEVRRAYPNAALLVAGPSGQFGSTTATALTEGIGAAGGRWLGPVPDAALADVFRCLDVCAMPTRQDEMFGMAAAEALSSGTPVVCSDLGGLPEVVPDTAGRLVPPGDPAALAATLLELCRDESRRALLAAAAPAEAERYTWPAIAERSEQIYHDVRQGRWRH